MLALRLRDDDRAVIEDIQQKLGGRYLFSERHSKNPLHGNQLEWRTTNIAHVIEICELILSRSLIPSKKLDDVRHVLDFAQLRKSIGYHFSDEERGEADRRLKLLRKSRGYRTT